MPIVLHSSSIEGLLPAPGKVWDVQYTGVRIHLFQISNSECWISESSSNNTDQSSLWIKPQLRTQLTSPYWRFTKVPHYIINRVTITGSMNGWSIQSRVLWRRYGTFNALHHGNMTHMMMSVLIRGSFLQKVSTSMSFRSAFSQPIEWER